jgi:hypothetical protein
MCPGVACGPGKREEERMTTVGCLRCGVWYDPARPHACRILGDEMARRLEERPDAFERRLQGLELEARSRLNALERRVQELEAQRMTRQTASNDEDPLRFDRKANHRRYGREWRARQAVPRSHP